MYSEYTQTGAWLLPSMAHWSHFSVLYCGCLWPQLQFSLSDIHVLPTLLTLYMANSSTL